MNVRTLTIRGTDDPVGVEITDDIQGVTTVLRTDGPVEPTPTDTDGFVFPVDAAVRLGVTEIRIPQYVNVIVRNADGRTVAEGTNRAAARVPPGTYVVEVASLAVKVYVAVEGAVETTTDDVGRRIVATDTDHVRLGVRSRHEYPAATITTTDDPRDVMRALSCLGSSLKTTSPERAWPTLRGHPPLVELGERFAAPEGFERRGDEVRIEVPPALRYVFPVASLAHYLDATVRPGPTPRLVTAGTTVPLVEPAGRGSQREFERRVHRTLAQVFTLDCVVRTEGLYSVRCHEREAVAGRLDLDLADLYDRPLAERLAAYLEVPYAAVEPAVPTWKQTVDVVPAAANVAHLPFAAADLAQVRCPSARAVAVRPRSPTIDEFCRSGGQGVGSRNAGDARERPVTGEEGPVVRLDPTDSIEQTWIGEGVPVGASKPTLAACKRRLDAQPSGPIGVAVVSNSPEMRAETDVTDLYGLREFVAFDVEMYEDLTRAELRDVLAEERDFVHYVGHVDERGMQCADGWLDAATLDAVGTRAFVLNACRSYAQGMHLVRAGAIAGVVTLVNVGNEPATRVGRTLARLLNAGFSLAGALDILGTDTITGRQYTVVGDGQVVLAEGKGGTPMFTEIESVTEDRCSVRLYGYPTTGWSGMGALYVPTIEDNDRGCLNVGEIGEFTVGREELDRVFDSERFPVRTRGELRWSDELSADDVLE
ncbi:CHAT domain-containing protein [Halomarina pelagica]|uniref:CHAT domain-containing protein n=1 Tax=Halomarina pelagica TaxID=2961599 RepID=UPI0020C1C8B4|nr:CHAT domain-containing protein [Halomarina sp. BND7]